MNETPQNSDTVLVTGGAGFIGSCFCREWFDTHNSRLLVLDKLTYAGNMSSLEPVANRVDFTFHGGDVTDAKLLTELFETFRPRAVVHLAAETHVDRSITQPAEFIKTNVVGTFQLLESTLRYWSRLRPVDQAIFRFLHVSTDEVFGSLGGNGTFNESSNISPNSPYAASKAAADHFVRAYFRTYGLPTITTNCSNNYGPYQFPEKLIPTMILNAMAGQPLPVYGDGQQIRDWLHVEDHCTALRHVIERGLPGETYNVGGNCECTNLSVVEQICNVVDSLLGNSMKKSTKELITFVEDRPGHDRRYAVDSSKIKQQLDWQPRHTFRDGLEQTVRWYAKNSEWLKTVTDGGHQREGEGIEP